MEVESRMMETRGRCTDQEHAVVQEGKDSQVECAPNSHGRACQIGQQGKGLATKPDNLNPNPVL